MLFQKSDSHLYVQEFKKRFTNFCEKAPLLLSFTTTPTGVQVIDETKNAVFDIEFDYSVPVKSLIHGIKQMLIEKDCYPSMRQVDEVIEDVPRAEQLRMIESGVNIEQVPTSRIRRVTMTYLLDKVVVFRDQFVVRNMDTNELFLYKMNKSSIFFLQKLRRGRLTPETAAVYFFENSTLLNKIETKQ